MPGKTTNKGRNRSAIGRRQFLAAGAALPWLVPGSALGANGSRAASERLGVALIGCGKMGSSYHLNSLSRKADVEMLAVCEVDTTRREAGLAAIARHYQEQGRKGRTAGYNDFREALGRGDIDAVCIATPDHWHVIPAILAARAGKHVYCEKPLSVSLAEAKRLVEVVRQEKVCFQVGSQQRSNVFGPFCEAVDIIRSGRLGKIHKVHVTVGGPPDWQCALPAETPEPGLDWNLWLGPAPERPYNSVLSPRGVHKHFPQWRHYFEYASGGHGDMGAHHYDIALWALERDRSGPILVVPPEKPDAGRGVRFVYADGGPDIIHGGDRGGCVFYGDNGWLHIERGKLESEPAALVADPLPASAARIERVADRDHHQNWLDAIRASRDPIAPVEAGAAAAMLIHLGNLAYRHGVSIKWDPVRWRFVGGTADASWLDRPRRDPWQLP